MVVFDLDDTLYKEETFVESAYKYIANKLENDLGQNIYNEMLALRKSRKVVLDVIKAKYSFKASIQDLVHDYRFHFPEINLSEGALVLLEKLKKNNQHIGLMTDGRSLSQRNKIKSLNIEKYFDYILISEEFGSEKPSKNNYQFFVDNFPSTQYVYIGDNFNKDFVSANELNWLTIGLLDNGQNIHKQNKDLPITYLPKRTITSLKEIKTEQII